MSIINIEINKVKLNLSEIKSFEYFNGDIK